MSSSGSIFKISRSRALPKEFVPEKPVPKKGKRKFNFDVVILTLSHHIVINL